MANDMPQSPQKNLPPAKAETTLPQAHGKRSYPPSTPLSEYGILTNRELILLASQKIFVPSQLRTFLHDNGVPDGSLQTYSGAILHPRTDMQLTATARARAAFDASLKAVEENRSPLSAGEMSAIIRSIPITYKGWQKPSSAGTPSRREKKHEGLAKPSATIRYTYDTLPPEIKRIYDDLFPVLKGQHWNFESLNNAGLLSCRRQAGVAVKLSEGEDIQSRLEELYCVLYALFPDSEAIKGGRIEVLDSEKKSRRPTNGFIQRLLANKVDTSTLAA